MSTLLTMKRPFIWLRRFRNRCGYGVHSPFAFDLITTVIYEKGHYYAFDYLENKAGKTNDNSYLKQLSSRTKKINRFLFRLVNRVQPATIIDEGEPDLSASYLQAACKKALYIPISGCSKLTLDDIQKVDFLYLHNYHDPAYVEKVFDYCIQRSHSGSVFVIEGIQYSKAMRKLWKRFIHEDKAGITFDLYDLGIIFFDKSKIKQDYRVNF